MGDTHITEPLNKRTRWLQRLLIGKGYNIGEASGVMNVTTKSALRNFQQEIGLPITGRFDKDTVGALRPAPDGEIKNDKPVTKSRTAFGAGGAGLGGAAVLVKETVAVVVGQKDALSSGDIITIVIAVAIIGGALVALYARLDDGGYLDDMPWRKS